ncbi:hypothetical protein ACFL5O_03005 [Myxococcota bacterium]
MHRTQTPPRAAGMTPSVTDPQYPQYVMAVATESLVTVLGVVYVHRKTTDGGDLYLTRFGLAVAEHLALENWHERSWFEAHRERLDGTSAVYRVPTKEVGGQSLELVVKTCRVGEDVPVDTRTLLEFVSAEFNSPWEEFALVMELGEGRYGPTDVHIQTQHPLAIYVPPETMQIWQSGRSQAKINRIRALHPGIELDILRQYKLVYGWIKGRDAVHVLQDAGLGRDEIPRHLEPLNRRAIEQLAKKGFAVADMKPAHIVLAENEVRQLERLPARSRNTDVRTRPEALRDLVQRGAYSLVDYELLLRTPEHEELVNQLRRHSYLDDVCDRYLPADLPEHLEAVELLDVPYVTGQAESTGGRLWVVGRSGRLFDYFLPERWRRTHAWKLSSSSEVYYTITKDRIHLIWKISRVGERPLVSADSPVAGSIEQHGYNSPFEEFALAHELTALGIPVVNVRAIYCTGTHKLEPSTDLRRYRSHSGLRGPDGHPVLHEENNYITLRGYYNGPDAWVAKQSGRLCRPVNLSSVVRHGILASEETGVLFEHACGRLRRAGFDGSLLNWNDFLVVLDPHGELVRDDSGEPEVRLCDFELLRRL